MPNNRSAFPIIPPVDSHGMGSAAGYPFPEGGMTLHNYFAAKAMQAAIIAAGSWGPSQFRDFDVNAVAEFADRQADAMMDRLERGEK